MNAVRLWQSVEIRRTSDEFELTAYNVYIFVPWSQSASIIKKKTDKYWPWNHLKLDGTFGLSTFPLSFPKFTKLSSTLITIIKTSSTSIVERAHVGHANFLARFSMASIQEVGFAGRPSGPNLNPIAADKENLRVSPIINLKSLRGLYFAIKRLPYSILWTKYPSNPCKRYTWEWWAP
jgi:hypothetical protein